MHSPPWNAANNESAIPVRQLVVKTPEKAHVLARSKSDFGKRLTDGSPPRKPKFFKLLKVPEGASAKDALGPRLERHPPLYVHRPDLDLAPLDELVAHAVPETRPDPEYPASFFGALEDRWADAAASSGPWTPPPHSRGPWTPPSPCRALPSAQMVPPSPARQTPEALRRNPNTTIRLDLGRASRRQNLRERHLRLLAAEVAVA